MCQPHLHHVAGCAPATKPVSSQRHAEARSRPPAPAVAYRHAVPPARAPPRALQTVPKTYQLAGLEWMMNRETKVGGWRERFGQGTQLWRVVGLWER